MPGAAGVRPDASGSTSLAAAIMEALEVGATALLLDEDGCATNLLIRDARMQSLVARETITPLIDRVRQLHEQAGVSTVLVVGGEVHSSGLDRSTRGRDVTVLFGDGAGAAVAWTAEIVAADLAAEAEALDQFRDRLDQSVGGDLYSYFGVAVANEAGVATNPQAVDALLSQVTY